MTDVDLYLLPTPVEPTEKLMQKNPVLILIAGLWGVLNAGLVMSNALEWTELSGEQMTAIGGFVTVTCGLAALVLRASVYSPATVAQIEASAAVHPANGHNPR